MAEKKSRLQPQSPYWYEDLPNHAAPLKVGDDNEKPNLHLDLSYIDENVFELSRATSIQRGFGLVMGMVILIGFWIVIPFFVRLYLGGRLSFFIPVILITVLVVVIYSLKRCIRTPLDLPVLFDRRRGRLFAQEYVAKINPFAKWKTVIKEFDWSCVEAEIGKIAGYNGKTYSVRYGLILAQCDPGTTQVKDRIILKQAIDPGALSQMWAYIRCYMNEGPEKLGATKPFPRDVSFRRCMLEFYPFFDFTEEGKRIRAKMHIVELVFLFIVAIPMFWLFLPAGLCEYIAQRLAPKPTWPEYVVRQTGLRSGAPGTL